MKRKYSNPIILYDPNKINDCDVSGLIEDYLGIAAGVSEDFEQHYAAGSGFGGCLDAYRIVTNRTLRRSFHNFARSQATIQRLADDTFFLKKVGKR